MDQDRESGQGSASSAPPAKESRKEQRESIRETGSLELAHRIYLLSVIGEIEGHECLPSNSKTTKYEHVLPKLAAIEDSPDTDGLLLLLNTVGGDVEAGLAIAEMIASLSKPTVSLVLGGSHSIDRRIHGLFVYRAERYHGHSSGAHERHSYWRSPDVRLLQANAGPHPRLYRRAFQGLPRTA